MSPGIVAPLIAALVLGAGVTSLHRRLPPMVAARMVAITVVVVAAAALPTLWMLALDYAAHVRVLGSAWCNMPITGDRVNAWVGTPTLVLAAVGAVRAANVLRSHHRLRSDQSGAVEVAERDEPFAVTLPGRGGHVLISRGLLAILEPDEQVVVLAHEHAHARHRHDRYLLAARVSTALLPMLRPLASRLEFALERWADEAAVTACGDRQLVARTLGKVALATNTPSGALSFNGVGVPARVAALLALPPPVPRSSTRVVLFAAIAMVGVFGAIQVHHLAGLIASLCFS
ncbi:MAG: M48 family metalloprotease [Ilumatobacteraceae bacterium]